MQGAQMKKKNLHHHHLRLHWQPLPLHVHPIQQGHPALAADGDEKMIVSASHLKFILKFVIKANVFYIYIV
jgi:hypothetical protein